MYELLMDNAGRKRLTFISEESAYYWYDRIIELGIASMALWNESRLLKFYIKQEVNTNE